METVRAILSDLRGIAAWAGLALSAVFIHTGSTENGSDIHLGFGLCGSLLSFGLMEFVSMGKALREMRDAQEEQAIAEEKKTLRGHRQVKEQERKQAKPPRQAQVKLPRQK